MTVSKKTPKMIAVALMFFMVFGVVSQAAAQLQHRIVVLPFYTENGTDPKDAGELANHYRRVMGFLENQLVANNFQVIDPFAKDAKDREYNRIQQRAREDSALACQEMCKRYATDAAYVLWLDVTVERTPDGYYKSMAKLDGRGYDSAARSLGANVYQTFKVTRLDRDDSINSVEKEAGDMVGRILTDWGNRRDANHVVSSSGVGNPQGGGVIARQLDKNSQYVNVRLDGANEYEITEVFGKVLNTVHGVRQAKQYSSTIVPDNPQASHAEWQVMLEGTEPFRMQANMMKMVNQILDNGGEMMLNGVPYRFSSPEVKLLMGLRPGSTTANEVQFVIDRDRMRRREFSQTHDPANANRQPAPSPGFN